VIYKDIFATTLLSRRVTGASQSFLVKYMGGGGEAMIEFERKYRKRLGVDVVANNGNIQVNGVVTCK
jgi:hypothetical protein